MDGSEPPAEAYGCGGMPEHMRAMGGAVDMGAVERPSRNRRHGFWAERVERGDRRQKHLA